MLNKIIDWSLAHRGMVVCLSLIIVGLGTFTALHLPVEVLPDLTKPTVVILTEASGLAPEEVEARISRPLENALMGIPGLSRLRSISDVSLSLVYAEFQWNSDTERNRMRVRERLQGLGDQLPEGIQPYITPEASLMGEILLVGVRSTLKKGEEGYLPPSEVRSLADWVVKPHLQTLPGIAEVLNMGGGIRRIEVQPDPYRMQAHDIAFSALEAAIQNAAHTTTGGFLSDGSKETMVRNLAMTTDPETIGSTIVKKEGDRLVRISDVARVQWGIEPMRGDATVSRSPEKSPTYGVIMSITKAPGADTRQLTDEVKATLEELQYQLPKGIEVSLLFQQKDFIDQAIGNLKRAIVEAAVMVTLVLFIFLLNIRTTLITLTAIPTSFAITMLTFKYFGVSVNSMTLGGLAVAIGMVVDDAIVDVENVYRRLKENRGLPQPLPTLRVISHASAEIRGSILYATLLIILVFVPLLALSGIEGRLFTPIAIATITSISASFFVSLTIIPVLCSFLLKPSLQMSTHEGGMIRMMKQLLKKSFLRLAFNYPTPILILLLLTVVGAFLLYSRMGNDFLPAFEEETALVAATSAPGTSLEEMNRISDVIEEQILSIPEVHRVGRRLGRAERGDHVVPVSTAEFDVDFKSVAENGKARSRREILEDLRRRVQSVPGIFAVVGGPLADRIGHMMSGVSAPVAIKIFGPDLDVLRRMGTRLQDEARMIPGFEDARLDQQSSIPQLRIEADRNRCAAYGITPGELNTQLSTWIGGKHIAELREDYRVVNLAVRLPEDWRDSPQRIAQIPIRTESGSYVPLSSLAEIREAAGPNNILRENGRRVITVAIKPRTRDVGTLVDRLKKQIAESIPLPQGYDIRYEGEFQSQREASQRIAWMSAMVFLAIVLLLTQYFRSLTLSLQALLNIPLALLGSVFFTWLLIDNISIATLIGFIAVGGIAARNGIMTISHYLHLMRHEGESFTQHMVERGTLERMAPVLMTALAAGIALIPLVFAADQPGKEILHPVAVAIVGGLISSTLLNFLVTPLVFFHFGKKSAQKAIR